MNSAANLRTAFETIPAKEYGLIVIGGGITGVGIAQNAAARGVETLLLEKGDFASGTSSKTTKIVHGGIRHVPELRFGLVSRALRERQIQKRIASHLVWSIPFIIPLYRGNWFQRAKLRLGLLLYDMMAGWSNHTYTRHISRDEVLRLCPGINPTGLVGGYRYFDCRTDDSRHTLEVLRSAVDHGAVAANYAFVMGFVRMGGEIIGVVAKDARNPDAPPRCFYGRSIINATGVWSEQVTMRGGVKRLTHMMPAKGTHIVLDRADLPLESGVLVPSAHDDRFCFALPWYDSILVGTTDTRYKGVLDHVVPETKEIQYILDALNRMFPNARLSRRHVKGAFAGLRPLIAEEGAESTSKISREHKIEQSQDGLISIGGGKLTTYRHMGQEAVDLALARIRKQMPAVEFRAADTADIVLGGWTSIATVAREREETLAAARALGLDGNVADYLVSVYGYRTHQVLNLLKHDPTLAKPVCANHPYIKAQLVYAARSEGAMTIDDVLSRRIRLALTDTRSAMAVAEEAAEVLAKELGWSADEKARQLAAFRMEVVTYGWHTNQT